MHRANLVALFIVSALCGCSSKNTTLANTLVTFSATDTMLGTPGRLRLSVGEPVSTDTTITLSTDNASAITLSPAKLHAGQSSVEITYKPLAVGNATITAKVGTSTVTASITVVSRVQVTQLRTENASVFLVGAKQSASVGCNIRVPQNTNVLLTSSDPSVLTVPAQITIPAYASFTDFTVTGLSAGAATITGTLGTQHADSHFSVVTDNSFGLNLQSLATQGSTAPLFLYFAANAIADTTVTLTSSDPTVATVAATAVLLAGSSGLSVDVVAVRPGTTTITAAVEGTAVASVLRVVQAPSILSFGFTQAGSTLYGSIPSLSLGLDAMLTLALDSAPLTAQTVTLTSSNPAVATVPATFTVSPLATFASIPITLLANGATTLTISLNDSTRIVPISVVGGGAPALVSFTTAASGLSGAQTDATLSFNELFLGSVTVQFTSSDPSVVAVPDSVTIAQSNVSAYQGFSAALPSLFTLKNSGSAFITATLGNSHQAAAVTVTAQEQFGYFPLGGAYQVGTNIQTQFSVIAANPQPMTFNITSSDPTLLAADPATVMLSPNQLYGQIALHAFVPATALGQPHDVTITVALASDPTIAEVATVTLYDTCDVASVGGRYGPGLFIPVGNQGTFAVNLPCATRSDMTVTLTDNNDCVPANLAMPLSVIVPAGSSGTTVVATGIQTATCVMGVAGSAVTGEVDVVP